MAVEYQPTPLPGCEALADPMSAPAPDPRETVIDWATGEVFPVHPAAAMFPMLAPDELADLAADIHDQGLLQAIVLDGDRQLIDGRNRLAACAVAEVTPFYTTLPHEVEPVAYILSLNIRRRHLLKSQQAMAVVKGAQFSPGEKRYTDLAAAVEVSMGWIGMAAVVQAHASDLVAAVLAGASLKEAYATAQRRRDAQAERDQAGAIAAANLRRLQAEHLDLAELVLEERLPLAEAVAIADKRARDARDQRRRMTEQFTNAAVHLWACIFETPEAFLAQWDPDANPWNPAHNAAGVPLAHLWTGDGLHQLAALLERLAVAVDQNGGDL